MIKDAMKKRPSRPMFFIDIAVPRDIDPKGAEIENTYLYDIDDLKSVVEANKKEREKKLKKHGILSTMRPLPLMSRWNL